MGWTNGAMGETQNGIQGKPRGQAWHMHVCSEIKQIYLNCLTTTLYQNIDYPDNQIWMFVIN